MDPELNEPVPPPREPEKVSAVIRRYRLGMWTRVRQFSDLKAGDIFAYFHPRTGDAIAQHEQGAYCFADGWSRPSADGKRNEIDTFVFRTLADALSFRGKRAIADALTRKPR